MSSPNGSIRFQLFRAFSWLFALIAALCLMGYFALSHSKEIAQLKDQMNAVQLSTLRLIKTDQDFFAKETINENFYRTGASSLKHLHEDLVDSLQTTLSGLLQEYPDSTQPLGKAIATLSHQVIAYDQHYSLILQRLLTRGFIDQGLEGNMRESAHQLESDFSNSLAVADLLMLRRHEKDFLLRKLPTYADQFEEKYHALNNKLTLTQEYETQRLLAAYRNDFLRLVHLEEELGLQNQTGLKYELNLLTQGLEQNLQNIAQLARVEHAAGYRNVYISLGISMAAILVIGLLIIYWQSQKLTLPIQHVQRALQLVVSEDFRHPFRFNAKVQSREMAALGEDINHMVNRIREQLSTIEDANEELATQNDRLTVAAEQLKESNGVKDKFFSIIAHDLKGPINSLGSFLDLLIKFNDSFSKEETTQVAKDIRVSLKGLSQLLENLLQWSRSQMGKLEYDPKPLDLSQLLQSNLKLYTTRTREKGISLRVEAPEQLIAKGDFNMIDFVVRNLLGNALKFTPPGGSITLRAALEGDQVQVEIHDTGIGISPEDQEKLFRPDQHLSRLGTANEKGTGLGLILCQEFIQKHHGRLWLESQPEEGTTFFFTLDPALEMVHSSS